MSKQKLDYQERHHQLNIRESQANEKLKEALSIRDQNLSESQAILKKESSFVIQQETFHSQRTSFEKDKFEEAKKHAEKER